MYAALWRALPGPVALRALLVAALLAAVVVVCFQWLFPLVASWMPYDETTVGAGASAGPGFGTSAGAAVPQPFSLREDLR